MTFIKIVDPSHKTFDLVYRLIWGCHKIILSLSAEFYECVYFLRKQTKTKVAERQQEV